ncbi:MAG TPA: pepsin/retropepsin-like aspartic protease family protein [Terriglobales bacterium]|nr:pepsin/retropepsin-like aspartic protease family protein [Terriglobales bacterium]
MGNKTLSWCIASLLLLSTTAGAKHKVQKIPFKLYREHLVVASGRLGHLENRNLLIDTGANPTVVDEALAHELGLKPLARPPHGMTVVGGVADTYYALLESLDIGPVHHEALVVAVANLSLMQAGAGVRIDAIVGLDALAPNNFQIDYDARKVIFGSFRSPISAVPLLKGTSFGIIETMIDSTAVNLAVDTGSSEFVLFRNRLPDKINSLGSTATAEVSNLAGDVLAPEVRLPNFKVGDEDLSGSTALLTTVPNCCEFQGIFGISALRFKRVTFDFQRGLFGMELLSQDRLWPEPVAGACTEPGRPGCRLGLLQTKR